MSERIEEIAAEICQNGVASAIEKYGEWINNKEDVWATNLEVGLLLGDRDTRQFMLCRSEVCAMNSRYSEEQIKAECVREMSNKLKRGIASMFLVAPRREVL